MGRGKIVDFIASLPADGYLSVATVELWTEGTGSSEINGVTLRGM